MVGNVFSKGMNLDLNLYTLRVIALKEGSLGSFEALKNAVEKLTRIYYLGLCR